MVVGLPRGDAAAGFLAQHMADQIPSISPQQNDAWERMLQHPVSRQHTGMEWTEHDMKSLWSIE